MIKFLTSLAFVVLATKSFAVDVTTIVDFTNPNSITPYYQNDIALNDITKWYSTSDANPWVQTTPVGSGNKYGVVNINGSSIKVLNLFSGSGIRIGVVAPQYIKEIRITCCNLSADLSLSGLGSLSSNYSSDFTKKIFEWTSSNDYQIYEVIFSVKSTYVTISQIEITYYSDSSGIISVTNEDSIDVNATMYDLGGKVKYNKDGIFIIRMRNGKVKKIIPKHH